jgi:hypothetical protein
MDRKQETKIVKDALLKAGYSDIKVGHGHGTAWGWLHASMTANRPDECRCKHEDSWLCTACQDIRRKANNLIMDVTGRHGEYDGNTNVSVYFK